MASSGRSDPAGPPRARFTPQAVDRTLRQLEARAAKASDETLTSAVITGRKALTEWQTLAGQLRQLEDEYEGLALSESRALARLQDVLDLLDKIAEPSRLASPRNRSGQFLTASRHRNVSRDELVAGVWPDADEDGGRHRLHQAVYELRRSLRAIDPNRSPVVCIDGGYRLDHRVPIWVDVEKFDDVASAAARCFTAQRFGEAIELCQEALKLYVAISCARSLARTGLRPNATGSGRASCSSASTWANYSSGAATTERL